MNAKISQAFCVCLLLAVTIVIAAQAHGLAEDRLHTLNHVIAQYPKDPAGYVKWGRVYQDSEQWEDALKDYAKALLIDPTYDEALYWQGKVFLQSGDYEQAKTTLQEYLSRESDSPAGNRVVAKVYSHLGKNLKAAYHYDMSISGDKNPPPQVYLERARILLTVNPIPAERINAGLLDAMERHGAIITFLELLIDLNIETRNYPEAIMWMGKLPENLAKSPHWLIRKAELEALRGYRDDAIKLYRSAIDVVAILPAYKQNLPAFVAARQKAERGILQLARISHQRAK